MASSYVNRSQSNIYLDDPDIYQQYPNTHHLQSQYSVSTMNMPSLISASSTYIPSSFIKSATSMQQLKESKVELNSRSSNFNEEQNMIMDQNQSFSSIPDIYEQEFLNERLMCIQQIITSGQNFASMFNDNPHYAQQIMTYMSSANYNQQEDEEEPEVIEIMDE